MCLIKDVIMRTIFERNNYNEWRKLWFLFTQRLWILFFKCQWSRSWHKFRGQKWRSLRISMQLMTIFFSLNATWLPLHRVLIKSGIIQSVKIKGHTKSLSKIFDWTTFCLLLVIWLISQKEYKTNICLLTIVYFIINWSALIDNKVDKYKKIKLKHA